METFERRILFVGGLSPAITEGELESHFSQYCQVHSVKIMKEKKTKMPKGFAYVTLEEELPADSEVVELTHIVHGRRVDVQFASKKGEKQRWKEELRARRVLVKNLPKNVSATHLEQAFSHFGHVVNAYIICDYTTAESKGQGYVHFNDPAVVERVIGSPVFVNGFQVDCLPYVGRHQSTTTAMVIPYQKEKYSKEPDYCPDEYQEDPEYQDYHSSHHERKWQQNRIQILSGGSGDYELQNLRRLETRNQYARNPIHKIAQRQTLQRESICRPEMEPRLRFGESLPRPLYEKCHTKLDYHASDSSLTAATESFLVEDSGNVDRIPEPAHPVHVNSDKRFSLRSFIQRQEHEKQKYDLCLGYLDPQKIYALLK